jgi:hypothetical protein
MSKKTSVSKIAIALYLPTKVPELVIYARNVHDTMAANSGTLPAPTPPLAVFLTDIDTLVAKQTVVQTRTAGAVEDRNAAQKVVVVDINNERAYVEALMNADPANAAIIAQDAGMQLRKKPSVNKAPLVARPGPTTGLVEVISKATLGAQANEWQYSLDGGKTYLDMPPTTKARTSIANLTPGTTVMFRKRVLTKDGLSDWSEPTSVLVT